MTAKRRNIVEPVLAAEPEIGRWLWVFEDCRSRTHEELEKLTPAVIDWLPPHGESSIGTVLYHMALIEADWLYVDVLEQEIPASVMALFPQSDRDAQGRLTQILGIPLAEHLERLAAVRSLVLEIFQSMSLADFRRPRILTHYDVTPEWVLYHLMLHEAEHCGQLAALRVAAERDLAQA